MKTLPYEVNGVHIYLKDFFLIEGRGVVFTGTLVELPDQIMGIDSSELRNLLIGQELFGRKILGVELYATMCQTVPTPLGLLVAKETK